MLFLHFQAAGVYGFADLAVMGFHMDQLILFGDGLCRLLVQTGLLIRVHVLFEEAEREFLRLFRETSPFRLLPEEHLSIFGQCLLGV